MNLVVLAAFLLVAAQEKTLYTQELEAHPRPDWQRPAILLNGPWQFDFDPADSGLKEKWYEGRAFTKTIQVPYPWQSELSGVCQPDYNGAAVYNGAAWYQRDISAPKVDGKRLFLIFGAVDWQATVWIDGKQVAQHEGGYTPFEVELTGHVRPGKTARLTVRAYDVTEPETPTGKQTGWYTQTGGIWQSVYLEHRGDSYIRTAHITPDIDAERAVFDCVVYASRPGSYKLTIQAFDNRRRFNASQTVSCQAGDNPVQIVLPMPAPSFWTPDSPTLYDARIDLGRGSRTEDVVRTYFGMRKISRGVYGDAGHEYILLNNKPVYLRGALHQSFNPKGIYTHPDDEFIRNDYRAAKDLGLNFLRIHIKVDEPRALYWADKLGVMLMCDMPNYAKNTPRAHEAWEQTLRAAVDRDFNHPAVIAWCLFNETWGIGDGSYTPETQQWVRDMYLLAKQIDRSRLVEDNSPCNYDHVVTDINSWHFYIDNFEKAAAHVADVVQKTFPGSTFNFAQGWKQDAAPLINSEYGGVSAGSGDRDISFVFLFLTNLLRKHDKICGYVYTELSDIEWEHNGFVNYDRSPKEYHYPLGITVAELQNEEFPVLDCPPYQRVDAVTRVSIPLAISHWSERAGLTMRISADGQTVDGTPWSEWLKPIERPLKDLAPYRVTPLDPIEIGLPNAAGIMNVAVEILHGGRRIAANYCVLDVRDGRTWAGENQFAVSFPVRDYAANTFADSARAPKKLSKVYGHGAGYIEYQLRLPRPIKPENIAGCRLVFEASSKAGTERLHWPAKTKPGDCPQTDGLEWPTDLAVSINGAPIAALTLENDFADARGILSHAAAYHHGSCGQLIDAPLTGEALNALLTALSNKRTITVRFEVPESAKNKGGLALYGNDMGAWPANPTLVFDLKPGSPKPRRSK